MTELPIQLRDDSWVQWLKSPCCIWRNMKSFSMVKRRNYFVSLLRRTVIYKKKCFTDLQNCQIYTASLATEQSLLHSGHPIKIIVNTKFMSVWYFECLWTLRSSHNYERKPFWFVIITESQKGYPRFLFLVSQSGASKAHPTWGLMEK